MGTLLIETAQAMPVGDGQRCTVFSRSNGVVQWLVFIRSIAGMVLADQVYVGIKRDFMSDKVQDLFGTREVLR